MNKLRKTSTRLLAKMMGLCLISSSLLINRAEANTLLRWLLVSSATKQVSNAIGNGLARGLAANTARTSGLDLVNTGATVATAYAMLNESGRSSGGEGGKSSNKSTQGKVYKGLLEYCNPRSSVVRGYAIIATVNKKTGQYENQIRLAGTLRPMVCRENMYPVSEQTVRILKSEGATILFTDSAGVIQKDIELSLSLID